MNQTSPVVEINDETLVLLGEYEQFLSGKTEGTLDAYLRTVRHLIGWVTELSAAALGKLLANRIEPRLQIVELQESCLKSSIMAWVSISNLRTLATIRARLLLIRRAPRPSQRHARSRRHTGVRPHHRGSCIRPRRPLAAPSRAGS